MSRESSWEPHHKSRPENHEEARALLSSGHLQSKGSSLQQGHSSLIQPTEHNK